MNLTSKEMAHYGFHFDQGFRGWITPENMPRIIQDAALVTQPNTAVPAEFAAYIDPKVVEILTEPLRARAVFNEVKKGDWTTPYAKFRMTEITGSTQPYSDYGQSRTSGVNNNWVNRENYLFQTVIEYGDYETAVTATAKINLVSDKQQAAARIIDIDSNKIMLEGVAGREIYGFLNDPSLPNPITPGATGTGSGTKWGTKDTKQRFNDILLLFRTLVKQTAGWVDNSTPMKLCMSPELATQLGEATDFNISVQKMIDDYFRRLEIVTIPQLYDETLGETMVMLPDEVQGQRVGEYGFSEKLRAGRIIPDLSSFSQKWLAGSYGAIIYMPYAVARMRGM